MTKTGPLREKWEGKMNWGLKYEECIKTSFTDTLKQQ
jgi:hypothetical protein